jgi:hypothetical protein
LLLRLNKTLLKEVLLIRVEWGSATVVVAANWVGRPTRCSVVTWGTLEGSIIKHLASLTCTIKFCSCRGDLGILGLRQRKSRLHLSRGFQREGINLLNLNQIVILSCSFHHGRRTCIKRLFDKSGLLILELKLLLLFKGPRWRIKKLVGRELIPNGVEVEDE